jgi:hypothetical protein
MSKIGKSNFIKVVTITPSRQKQPKKLFTTPTSSVCSVAFLVHYIHSLLICSFFLEQNSQPSTLFLTQAEKAPVHIQPKIIWFSADLADSTKGGSVSNAQCAARSMTVAYYLRIREYPTMLPQQLIAFASLGTSNIPFSVRSSSR